MINILQMPINPKDWAIVGPVILGIAILLFVCVYAAKQLGLVKKEAAHNGNGYGAMKTDMENLKHEVELLRIWKHGIVAKEAAGDLMWKDFLERKGIK